MLAFLEMLDTRDNEEKFIALYEKHKNLVFSIALKYLHDNGYAEDIVQETFFYIAKGFEKVGDVESKETRNYLATIARGFAIKKYNKIANETPVEEIFDTELVASAEVEDTVFERFDTKALYNAINELSDDYKIPLYLKAIYNMPSKEIAEILGISDATARKRVSLAKKMLKKSLEGGVCYE